MGVASHSYYTVQILYIASNRVLQCTLVVYGVSYTIAKDVCMHVSVSGRNSRRI